MHDLGRWNEEDGCVLRGVYTTARDQVGARYRNPLARRDSSRREPKPGRFPKGSLELVSNAIKEPTVSELTALATGEADGRRVPDIDPWQTVPFNVVPAAQLAVALPAPTPAHCRRDRARGRSTAPGPMCCCCSRSRRPCSLGDDDVTCDVPTGFIVVSFSVTLHVPAPAAILHDGFAGVSAPVCADARDGISAISEATRSHGGLGGRENRPCEPKGAPHERLLMPALVTRLRQSVKRQMASCLVCPCEFLK